ncbi:MULTISPECIES: MFS transporter [Kitasatospora]|uniref:Putative major facilitator superfamily transporter n=1 Tax=Kitasatospora setae (strain ATCC 33774 / DSM 43861 / JCM 3304 / KCC A-0304 / NBRC 14216 / KM-6054) TaxID=452652 RepID=E4NEZ9_KITSK|nr:MULTISPECIES: MFS transporter [Kitasatospora]BAJ30079.1 putative major facilitator superfamily transporter [Kitasatospora setae KM-6054]
MATTHPESRRRPRPRPRPRAGAAAERPRLRLSPLLALATAAFLGIVTEALPAGVLPEMARDLGVGEGAMGQTLTGYALATGLSAIPLARATARWPRKRLVLAAVAVLLLADAVTALSPSYPLTLAVRIAAGVAVAAIWSELVGYARRLTPPALHGRAIAVTGTGVPLALSLGIPLGTWTGRLIGWRPTFALVAVLAAALLLWIAAAVPDAPGRPPGHRPEPVRAALRLPGVRPVLFVTAGYVLAHNVLYTYVAALLDHHGAGGRRDLLLLVLGLSSVLGLAVTGALVDRRLRHLTLAATAAFLAATGLLLLPAPAAPPVLLAAALWGLGWGGVAPLFQTAVSDAGGDRGQTLLVTTWNTAMGLGGAAGGLLLAPLGPGALPWTALALLLPVLATTALARRHGFPPGHRGGSR